MYYIRGALNAASQYYKDLPTINPSTLTGAIDVIVVERPGPDGGTELACSPFHVRFGKLQILRPSDKKVNVLLNGNAIPFNMKIGEAGEAFWVFETDDDVPEDLITSPLLAPTKPDHTRPPTVGPFGASEHSVAPHATNSEPQDEITRAKTEAAKEATVFANDEPDFLDLDAPPNQPQPASLPNSVKPPPSPTKFGPSAFLHQANGRPSALQFPKERARGHASSGLLHVPTPQVSDVHLDVSGYHSKGASDQTVVPESTTSRRVDSKFVEPVHLRSPSTANQSRADYLSESDVSPNSTRPSSPEPGYASPSLLATQVTSEPSEVADPASEYLWEWGAFPLRSPMKPEDAQVFFPSLHDRSVSIPSPSLSPTETPPPHRTLVQLGSLNDSSNGKFVLNVAGKTFEFELSLCGPLGYPVREEDSAKFVNAAVTYHAFLEDPSIVVHPDLTMRWNNRYISRQDSSPLFSALVTWREEALGKRAPLVSEDDALSSQDERDRPAFTTQASQATSTWSRWWRSGRKQTTDSRPPLRVTSSSPAELEPATVDPPSPTPSPVSPPTASNVPDQRKFVKTLRLTSTQLKELKLNKGVNTITFSLSATGAIACTARIFVWDYTDLIVVSDIDGTITKSDALGHVMTFIGRDWTHSGVAKLYTDICRNGYRILYLTSRAIGQAGSTRHYLKGINQDNYQLPEGPVIMSPDRLFTSLHREVIMRRPEVFKMACLKDIQRLFGTRNPFYAGFGNRITDAASYLNVDIPRGRIFTIEYSGEVKMELLERSGFKSSYIHMTDLVDQMFPPVHRSVSPQFTDLNYWRTPIEDIALPDLSPPSPALSAKSEASTQSRFERLRNISFGRANAISLLSSGSRSPASTVDSRRTSPERPNLFGTQFFSDESREERAALSDDPDEEFIAQVRKRATVHGMPSSLPNSLGTHWESGSPRFDGEEDEQEDEDEGDDEDEDEADEEDEEDLEAATGEMEYIPFL